MGAIAPESSQVRPGFAGKVRYRKLKSNPLAGSHTPRGQGARKRRVWESLAVRSSTSFEMLFLRRNPGRRDAVIGYVLIHLCYLKALDGVLAWSQARIISATVSSASGDNFVWGSLTYHHSLGCKLAPGLSPSRAIHAGLCRGSTTGLSERDVTLIPGGMKGVESGISTLERNQLFLSTPHCLNWFFSLRWRKSRHCETSPNSQVNFLSTGLFRPQKKFSVEEKFK